MICWSILDIFVVHFTCIICKALVHETCFSFFFMCFLIRCSLCSWDRSFFIKLYLVSSFWNLNTARLISTFYLNSIFQNAKTGAGAEQGNWKSKSGKEVSSGDNTFEVFYIFLLALFSLVNGVIWNFVLWPYQQTTSYELNALSQEWRQLCVKNMEIQSACAMLETQMDSFKKEAAERWGKSRLTSFHRVEF